MSLKFDAGDRRETIAILGLGYVGLPLALEFQRYRKVIGYDLNTRRAEQLHLGVDSTGVANRKQLASAKNLTIVSDEQELGDATVYIVTVPTPINQKKEPDLSALLVATETVGRVLKPGNLVVYESTVYPGVTEEECVPVLEQVSGLALNTDFFVGYSPERVSPGDDQRQLVNIVKVTAGSCPEAADWVDSLYQDIIKAGTHRAESIRVAEAAKIIENTQRDVNIALINELAIVFNKLNLNTSAVLAAAATKWNFHQYHPGLVGGHCIGVDPYYLAFKAKATGYNPAIIMAARAVNDEMGAYAAAHLIDKYEATLTKPMKPKVLVMGITFKENCADIRNTRVTEFAHALHEHGFNVDIYDPVAPADKVYDEYRIRLIDLPREGAYDIVAIAVRHQEFVDLGLSNIKRFGHKNAFIYDMLGIWPANDTDLRL